MDTVLTSLNDPILIIDEEGTILNINEAALDLLEIKNEDNPRKIGRFFDFSMESNTAEFLTRLKRNGKWIKILKSKLSNDLNMLVLRHFSLTQDEKHFDYAINQIDNIEESIALFYENQIIDCNTTFAKLFQYSTAELKQKMVSDIIIDSNS